MIRLEYFERSDFPQLMQWLNNEEILMNWAGSLFSYPLTEASLEWYLSDVNDMPSSEAYIYRVVDEVSGKIVGHISLGSISKKNNSARISRVLVGSEERGKGYCLQMITEVLKIGFEQLGLHRISLGVYDFNDSAIKCYQRAGMVAEGRQRDVLKFKDTYWSLLEMSMLDSEWTSSLPQ